jgi:RHH-type transcriptional regulator, rel operon repressor / antitoxin RelB
MHGMIAKSKAKPWTGKGQSVPRRQRAAKALAAPGVVRLPPQLDERLTALAEKTGRSRDYYARKAIKEYIEDTEDYLLAVQADRASRRTYSLEEVKKRLGLDD